MKIKKYLLLLPLVALGLVGCGSNNSNQEPVDTQEEEPTEITDPVSYIVTYHETDDYTVYGLKSSYRAGDTVSFLIYVMSSIREVSQVAWNDNVIEPDVTGTYSFEMPSQDVVLTIDLTTNESALTINYVLPDGVSLSNDFLESYGAVETETTITLPIGEDENLTYTDTSNTVVGWATYDELTDTYTLLTSTTFTVSDEVTLYAYTNDYRGDDISEFDRNSGTNLIDYAGDAIFVGDDVSTVNSTGSYSNYSYT